MSVYIYFNMAQWYGESVTCLHDKTNFFRMDTVTGARLSQLFVNLAAPNMMRLSRKCAEGLVYPRSLWKNATADKVDITVATALPCAKMLETYVANVATGVGNHAP